MQKITRSVKNHMETVSQITSRDIFFMRRAIGLARRGTGRVHPNPLVGAVLVKNNRIIGEGAHERFGGPHAEVNAILNAGQTPAGSTLYVTLEPCVHFGKTPPCADFIQNHKIKKVVIASQDPNPLARGKGIKALGRAGIRTVVGVLEKEALEMNRDFNHWIRNRAPYVIVKAAQTLDGRIATKAGDSRWISGQAARFLVHELRERSDALLVGVNTVLRDDPRLTVRLPRRKRKAVSAPIKIVLDSYLRTPTSARIFSKNNRDVVILAVTKKAPKSRWGCFKDKAEILLVKEKNGRVDLKVLLGILAKRGVVRVLIEGGGEVIADAFLNHVVNEVYFFIAPKIIGGKNAISSVGGGGIRFLKDCYKIKDVTVRFVGKDLVVHGRL